MDRGTVIHQGRLLFISGMGVATITAARIYQGQLAGQPGEENVLEMEKFPHVALSKVCVDRSRFRTRPHKP